MPETHDEQVWLLFPCNLRKRQHTATGKQDLGKSKRAVDLRPGKGKMTGQHLRTIYLDHPELSCPRGVCGVALRAAIVLGR